MSPRSVRIDAPKRITFKVVAAPEAEVTLYGSFNNWEGPYKVFKQDKNDATLHTCICVLKPGRYEYKFQIDNQWILDEHCPNVTPNSFGSLNNYIEF